MAAFASLSFKTPMDTSIMPISLDSNTIAISRGADWGCSQLSFSSKFPHPPLSRPTFPSQSNPVSASITHPGTFPQPPGFQLAIPQSLPLSAAAALTSTDQHDDSPAACTPLSTAVSSTPSSSSAESDDGPRLSPPQNVIKHDLPSTVSSDSVPQLSDLAEYFRNEVGPDNTNIKRIDYLVEATQDFIQSASSDRRIFTTVLGLWLRIFDWSGNDDDDSKDDSRDGPSKPILRLIDLYRVYATIQGYFYFADFLYVIYFAHEVEQIAKSLDQKVGKGGGRTRQTVAASKTAEALGIEQKDVTAEKARSRNYRVLLRYGGPGLLLRIGPGVNTLWQHRLKEADIPLLLKYWKAHLPQLYAQARALDPFASRIIAVGMAAFGYSYHKLEATRSDLIDSIRANTNLQQLACDTKDLTITQLLRYLEEGPASLENRIQKKRRFSDFDDARPVKGESNIAGELEMSMTVHEEVDMRDVTVLWPMPGEQKMSMEGLWPEEQETPTMTGWAIPSWPMPGEPEMTDITRHLPEEVPTSTGMEPFERRGMSTTQPTQTLGLDASMMSSRQLTTEFPQTYENWADDTQEWM